MKILLNCALVLGLAACASSETVNDPTFQAGYQAGCGMAGATQEARSAMLKDQPDLFRRGFTSGVSACGGAREVGY